MRTLKDLADLVNSQAHWLITQGRLGFRQLDEAVDWIDTHLDRVLLRFILDRYAELVSAGRST